MFNECSPSSALQSWEAAEPGRPRPSSWPGCGAGSLLLIDPKDLSESNTTRVYGSTPEDVGHPKVEVLASHLRRVAPAAHIDGVIGTVTDEGVARLLTACDVVFGCTDDNAGRLVLSRLPTYYLTPVIDVGVLLSSTNGRLEGIDGRITILAHVGMSRVS